MSPVPHPQGNASASPPPARPARPVRRPRGVAGACRQRVAVLLLASLAVAAGVQAAARPMRFEHLSTADGLSQSFVNCILQDRAGFLWVGTQAGLNRYDGYGFEVFRHDPADPASLSHDWIVALAEDPATGDLWIATEGGGLARWSRATGTFGSYRHDPEDPASLSGDRVTSLAVDAAGSLWVGTIDAGLNRFDAATGSFRRFRHDPARSDSLASDQVRSIFAGRGGRLWVGTWAGLDRLDGAAPLPGRQVFVHHRHDPRDPRSLSDDRVRAIVEDGAGTLWVGTLGGLNRLTAAGGAFERLRHDPADGASLSHDWVRSLLVDRDGRLWVGTDGGLNLWRGEGRGFAAYHPDAGNSSSLGSDQIVHLHQDESGILWIAAAGAGLDKWNPATWSFPHYWNNDETASNNVFAISEAGDGGLWTGTLGGGLERLDRGSGEWRRFTHDPRDRRSLADDRVTALLHDRAGTLWVGTIGGGLDRLLEGRSGAAAGGFEHHRHDPARPDSLSADAVTSLHEDRGGRLWVGTHEGGLNLRRDDGTFRRFRHHPADPASLGSDRVLALAEDAEGHLWLATDGGGLNRLHPQTEAFLRLEHDPADDASLATDELLAVHLDSSGQLWVGTKGRGLDRLKSLDEATGRGAFEHHTRAGGLPDDHIWGIRSEASGALWLATTNGLARLDPQTGAIKSYDAGQGLQSNEFNLGAHYRSPSGELFFGGVGGFNAFFPEGVEADPHVPPVVLTAFTKINQPVRFDRPPSDVSEIALDYGDYAFSLEFAALDFTAPGDNLYRYRLEGFHDRWIDNGTRRWVSFTNLDPGRYLLRVQGAGSAGIWNEAGREIRIAVAPPPWKTWWAYALYALALGLSAAILAAVYSQRQKAVRQRAVAEHERERVAERERMIEEREGLISERERLISERELLAEKHEEILAELARSNAQLGRKNAELERFNYTVTHDLKSPLVTIKGFLGMLRHDLGRDDRERVEHDIERVSSAADKMQKLLEELLELSRASDPRRLAREEVRLNDVVAEVLELVSGMTDQRRLAIEVDPELGVVMADPVRLLQVYQNLLGNAIRYMGEVASPRIEVGIEVRPDARVFFVRDNGSGIDPRFHDKIFELFERLDATRGGTGVGLAVVKRIVELHGGRVWVESEGEGQGSTFCFTLGTELPEAGKKAGAESPSPVSSSQGS